MTEQLDVLCISPERFRASPQVGVPCVMPWESLAAYLSRPSMGESKDAEGGISPALYKDNIRRKANLVHVGALVLDLDEGGDVDRVADVLAKYSAIVHETFSSTDDESRCRAYVQLVEPVDAATYERTHAIARAHLSAVGLVADEGAKDASRLSYAPVRRPGACYRFRVTKGAPLDAHAVLAAQPVRVKPPPLPAPRAEYADAYVRAALQRAADEVSSSSAGVRHYTLSKEAFGLARLELDEHQIAGALLPAFVAAAGERRGIEGARTIRDAIRARRGNA